MPLPQSNSRVVIDNCRPVVNDGRFMANATRGVAFEVSADAFADGHDHLLVWARLASVSRGGSPGVWHEVPLLPQPDDRWSAWVQLDRVGRAAFEVVACVDTYGTLIDAMSIKFRAAAKVGVELEEAALMVEGRLRRNTLLAHDRRLMLALLAALRSNRAVPAKVAIAGRRTSIDVMRRTEDRSSATVSPRFPIWVDRALGGRSAWYEMFPRSEGAHPGPSGTLEGGTFQSAAQRLPEIAAMGFDIVYLPPINPIGITARKGQNNQRIAQPGDPGSPWAIGNAHGGHTDVNPELGTIADFDSFVAQARRHDLEVALDIAFQCSPDHPWVRTHPEWFAHRPDGTIKYAENPPKKYHDIFPFDFSTGDWRSLWRALRDVFLYWSGHGIQVFRVDNPHTKPIAFWEWVISEVRSRHPEAIFLAEAFTTPRLMHRLAKVGFTQSYTYFTWRNSKHELSQYLAQLSKHPAVDYFRPNFWPSTPDILPRVLQNGGPAAFRLRLVLAALCTSSWGLYSGYELSEGQPLHQDGEEYMHSEKYEYRVREWSSRGSLAPLITRINAIRNDFPNAIAQLANLRLHGSDNDQILCVSRMSHERAERLLVIANLDPYTIQEATVWLDLAQLGIDETQTYEAHDLLTDTTYVWRGPANYVRLDPEAQPAHVLHLRTH